MNDQQGVYLSGIIKTLVGDQYPEFKDTIITGITLDSRKVSPGNIFVANQGKKMDGHLFIPEAIQRGAAAIIGSEMVTDLSIPYIHYPEPRYALALVAAQIHGYPARQMTMIGVTGTDGKTTTISLISEILKAAGIKTGLISTIFAIVGDNSIDTGFHVTTPEAPEIQNYLARMRSAGTTHVLIETTSHGLDQHRVTACDFDIAVITNIAHEHLDYHGTFEAYRDAKAKLFIDLEFSAPKDIKSTRGAILNNDDPSYSYLQQRLRIPSLSYGMNNEPDIKGKNVTILDNGMKFLTSGHGLTGKPFNFVVETPLIGYYNVYNCLAAISVTKGLLDIDNEAIRSGIDNLKSIPGRMEHIDVGQNFRAIVDFAHTPNALKEALRTVRDLTSGKVIVVFGSAGLRDREKRRLMAEISAQNADISILTAEDPRTESLDLILEEMADGIESKNGVEGITFWRIPDRGEAIRFAVSKAKEGDVVIVFGKGHEQSMCFGDIEYAWDDRKALRAALSDHLGLQGPQIPYLPTQKKSV